MNKRILLTVIIILLFIVLSGFVINNNLKNVQKKETKYVDSFVKNKKFLRDEDSITLYKGSYDEDSIILYEGPYDESIVNFYVELDESDDEINYLPHEHLEWWECP